MKRFTRSLAAIICVLALLSSMYVLPVGAEDSIGDIPVEAASQIQKISIDSYNDCAITAHYLNLGGLYDTGDLSYIDQARWVIAKANSVYGFSGLYGNTFTTMLEVKTNYPEDIIRFDYEISAATEFPTGGSADSSVGDIRVYHEDISNIDDAEVRDRYRIAATSSTLVDGSYRGSYEIDYDDHFYIYFDSPQLSNIDISGDQFILPISQLLLANFTYEYVPKIRTVYVEPDYYCPINVYSKDTNEDDKIDYSDNYTTVTCFDDPADRTFTYDVRKYAALFAAVPSEDEGEICFVGYKVRKSDESEYPNNYYTDQQDFYYRPEDDYTTIQAETLDISDGSSVGFLAGDRINGFRRYTYLFEAISHPFVDQNKEPKMIISIGDYNEVSGSDVPDGIYTIPEGVTLFIPFDNAHTYFVDDQDKFKDKYRVYGVDEERDRPLSEADQFAQLTLTDGAVIKVSDGAAICVGGQPQSTDTGSYYNLETNSYTYLNADGSINYEAMLRNGPVHQGYGVLEIKSGSSVVLENGANLYAWGFVIGEYYTDDEGNELNGKITAGAGSKVCEFFQVNDFRRGSDMLAMVMDNNNNQFPFNQYYVQNIGCEITYEFGSRERVFASFRFSSMGVTFPFFVDFVVSIDGSEGFTNVETTKGFFMLEEEGSALIRKYDLNKDTVTYSIEGRTTIASLYLKLEADDLPPQAVSYFGENVSIEINSDYYYMPISNMQIVLEEDSVLSARGNYVFLPGSSLTVNESATLYVTDGLPDPLQGNITTGCDIIFAGKEIGDYSYNQYQGKDQSTVPFKPAMYFPGANTLTRVWDNPNEYQTATQEASLNNNGNITVHDMSSLRSLGEANIYSSDGTGEFTIGRTDNESTLTVRGYTVSGNSTQAQTISATCDPPQLRNYDPDTGEYVLSPISADTGAWYKDWYFEGATRWSQGHITQKEVSPGVYEWGDYRNVTYFNAPRDVEYYVDNSDEKNTASDLRYYEEMNVSDKEVNEAIAEEEIVKHFYTKNEYGVYINEYNFIESPSVDNIETTDIDENNWKYEPKSYEEQGEIYAYPKYTVTPYKHTVTFKNTDGSTLFSFTGDNGIICGDTPDVDSYIWDHFVDFMEIREIKDSQGKYHIFAGWKDDNTGIIYKPGDQLPKIEKYNNPSYTIVYKECFEKHSLTLADDVITNFYIRLPFEYTNFDAGYINNSLRVEFTWGNKYLSDDDAGNYQYATDPNETYELNHVITSGDILTSGIYGMHVKMSVPVAAKELNDTITARLYDNRTGALIAEEQYSAADYLYTALEYDIDTLASSIGVGSDEKAVKFKELCVAVLAYGASAQLNFGYHTSANDLADAKLKTQKYIDLLADEGLILDPDSEADLTEGQTAVYTHDNSTYLSANQSAIRTNFGDISESDSDSWLEEDLWTEQFTGFPFRDYSHIFSGASTAYYGSSLTLDSNPAYDLYFRFGLLEDDDPNDRHEYWCSQDNFTMYATLSNDQSKVYSMTRESASDYGTFICLSITV